MASAYNLTTEQGLVEYLVATRSEHASVKLLSGGTANYVYRCTKEDGSTSIFKHAAPYLHSNKNFAFDPTRMDYEANILTQLASENKPFFNPPSPNVHAVRLLNYDKTKKLLEIEDGGSRNLKDAYTDPELNIAQIGQDIATWLAALHSSSGNISLALPDRDSSTNNNSIGVAIYRHSYQNLHAALEQFGYDTRLARHINEKFGSLLATDDECICHGDFWPGNILVRINDKQSTSLTIVDWEMVRRGTSATDVAQFAAEAFLLDRFRGARGLRATFLRAYFTACKDVDTLGKMWLRRMVVHWAVHVAFWPTGVEWTDNAGTKQLVDIGIAALEGILQDDWQKVLDSPLLKDVTDVCALVLEKP
jgi:5-methylthioribose kinase